MDDIRKRTMEMPGNDIISKLPDNVIDVILDHLPIFDVVRTSILSRKWRHRWRRVGNLVFDEKFTEIIQKISKEPTAPGDDGLWRTVYINAVCSLLLLHDGPINKFFMHLPAFEFGDYHIINGIVCNWVHALSLHGVKDFNLDASDDESVALPSYIFDCQEMRHLALHYCKVSLPFIRGFKNLISLRLDLVWMSDSDLNTLISNCPLLEELFLCCIDDDSFSLIVCALNLRTLELEDANIKVLLLQNVPNLETLSIKGSLLQGVDAHTLEHFFRAMPKVTDLTFCGETLTGWTTQGFPKMLPTLLDSLNSLSIVALNQAEPKQMYGILCILRSSPNLQRLNLSITGLPGNEMADAEAAAATLLEEEFTKPCHLNSLKTVKMEWLEGNRAQIAFVKFILTSCSALELLYLIGRSNISKKIERVMISELLNFNPASSKIKIIYTKE